jgi:hypothetical protein
MSLVPESLWQLSYQATVFAGVRAFSVQKSRVPAEFGRSRENPENRMEPLGMRLRLQREGASRP